MRLEDVMEVLKDSGKRRYDFILTLRGGEEVETSFLAGSWAEALSWLSGTAIPDIGTPVRVEAAVSDTKIWESPDGKPVVFIPSLPQD